MSLYVFPSLIAIALKLWILWLGRILMKSVSGPFKLFFLAMFFVNIAELAAFFFILNPQSGLVVLIGYYFFATLGFWSLLALTLDNANQLTPKLRMLLMVCFVGVIAVLVAPDAALLGVESIGYSITRIAGPYYFVIQLGLLVPLLSSLVLLFYFSGWGASSLIQRKAKILLLACSPIFAASLLVIVLMQLGYRVNASVVLSLMITITMFILLMSERKEYHFRFLGRGHLYKIARLLPRSRDNRFVSSMVGVVTHPHMGLAQGKILIEQEMIREALVLSGDNKAKAAEMLGISRQTLMRRLEAED